ncbi:MAG: hypothetical protein AMK70_14000 [Nitrospira bacterium SG8_35_1]|nr:MAG: hypothetical protein AMK70_14000 [Nitrospira bacterium SG8_35_1]
MESLQNITKGIIENRMERAEISHIAQEISFAFEDHFNDREKRKLFYTLFDRYLAPLDPADTMEPYDAIIKLGRSNPAEFDQMVKEMKESALIPDSLL